MKPAKSLGKTVRFGTQNNGVAIQQEQEALPWLEIQRPRSSGLRTGAGAAKPQVAAGIGRLEFVPTGGAE